MFHNFFSFRPRSRHLSNFSFFHFHSVVYCRSNSSSPFSNPLVTVPKAPITIGIIVTFMFHSFFQFSSKVEVLILLFAFFQWSDGTAKSTIFQIRFFLLIIIRSGLLAEIRWSVYISKSHGNLWVLFSKTGTWLCIYHLFVWSNLNFIHISQWISLPTQSCVVLYSFCANLLHSLIMWLMVSSLSPHSLHLIFCCVLYILALIWLVLMALFSAAIRRDSVSLLKFLFLCSSSLLLLLLLLLLHGQYNKEIDGIAQRLSRLGRQWHTVYVKKISKLLS